MTVKPIYTDDQCEAALHPATDVAVWHPYATVPSAISEYVAESTDGIYVTLKGGIKLIDAMSSWWAAALGHKHPAVVAAAKQQIDRMPHIMFGGLTHDPAENTAKKLLSMTGPHFEHVFFADSGSVAVEVALKMAMQAQMGLGQPQRTKIMTWRGGYHGDTLGAMSVCDPDGGMHSIWKDYLPQQIFLDAPQDDVDSYINKVKKDMEGHWEHTAALILEPIVQGAGGMRMHKPELVRALSELAHEHGVLVIYDEIATGLWRTGELFAFKEVGFEPDILCLGKAMTSGFMTFAATIATERVATAVGTLMHGPTFMGNPLAAAVSGAVLELLSDPSWAQTIATIESQLCEGLAPAADLPQVAEVRVRGAIGVIELQESLSPENFKKVTREAMKRGVWIRPFGKLIYAMPPYICSAENIAQICGALVQATALIEC
ncbi:MAG: adenosylmethionine--8-amino-7-oxononanoate transaminase [Corynebacterium sp.]|nr:adenosylmethionine--8-amino-7-oxononanoate transaminase [Corynebacterium sp.]